MTCQRGAFTPVIYLILSVAMETVMLKQDFIHCRLISFTCTYSASQNRNQLTPNYRCYGSFISEFIKFKHASRPIIYPTQNQIYTV